MNIKSVASQAVIPLPTTNAAPANTGSAQPAVTTGTGADSFQPAQNEKLVNMLQQQPDVRSEAVERAKAMVSDPNYPSKGTIANLAKMFVADAGTQE